MRPCFFPIRTMGRIYAAPTHSLWIRLHRPAFPSGSQTPKGLLKKSEDGDFAVIPVSEPTKAGGFDGIQADGNGRKAGMRRFGAGGGIPLTLASLISSGFRHSPE